ncbi:MAG TPA: MOSC domain-containing protein [Candidatus Aquicultor sp.]|jgi:MOSC domain-containing protein YiiM
MDNTNGTAKIIAVNTSPKKGMRKKNIGSADIKLDHGIVGDAHAADWHRQISLLAQESIDKMVAMGLKVGPGDFAENLTTIGIDLLKLPIGTRVTVGDGVVLEVTQIGKECHTKCAIYRQAGDCVMPKEGIFVKVITEGKIAVDDEIAVVK